MRINDWYKDRYNKGLIRPIKKVHRVAKTDDNPDHPFSESKSFGKLLLDLEEEHIKEEHAQERQEKEEEPEQEADEEKDSDPHPSGIY